MTDYPAGDGTSASHPDGLLDSTLDDLAYQRMVADPNTHELAYPIGMGQHPFEAGHTGRSCDHLYVDSGNTAEECGLGPNAPIHFERNVVRRPRDGRMVAFVDNEGPRVAPVKLDVSDIPVGSHYPQCNEWCIPSTGLHHLLGDFDVLQDEAPDGLLPHPVFEHPIVTVYRRLKAWLVGSGA